MIMCSEHVRSCLQPRLSKMYSWKQISKFAFKIEHNWMLLIIMDVIFSAYENLIELGIYKNLKAFIDTDKSPNASQNGYVVSFDGDEMTRITGTIGTEIGQNDGALTAELVSPNIFGRGERLSINYSYSYIKATEMNLKFLKPFYHTEFGDYKPE